jgi:hypothetical protein
VSEAHSDPLEELRADLGGLDDLPSADRVEVFDRANRVLAAELAELDEV